MASKKIKKVEKHLKGDIKDFNKEAKEDRELLKDLKKPSKKKEKNDHKKNSKAKKTPAKLKKVMHEFKERELHSGSKKGPIVSNPKQALAIGYSEARKAGEKVAPKKAHKRKK